MVENIGHISGRVRKKLKSERLFWSGIPESDRCHLLGRQAYYHYTNPAQLTKNFNKIIRFYQCLGFVHRKYDRC